MAGTIESLRDGGLTRRAIVTVSDEDTEIIPLDGFTTSDAVFTIGALIEQISNASGMSKKEVAQNLVNAYTEEDNND